LRTRPPADLDRLWLQLHGTAGDRNAVRLARLTVNGIDSTSPPEAS
jgi:cation/acetate symporter